MGSPGTGDEGRHLQRGSNRPRVGVIRRSTRRRLLQSHPFQQACAISAHARSQTHHVYHRVVVGTRARQSKHPASNLSKRAVRSGLGMCLVSKWKRKTSYGAYSVFRFSRPSIARRICRCLSVSSVSTHAGNSKKNLPLRHLHYSVVAEARAGQLDHETALKRIAARSGEQETAVVEKDNNEGSRNFIALPLTAAKDGEANLGVLVRAAHDDFHRQQGHTRPKIRRVHCRVVEQAQEMKRDMSSSR